MNLRQQRIKLGLSQRGLARKAKISRGDIADAEKRNKWPQSDLTFSKYALALGLKVIR
jgi:predicted transcriptional regulator